MLLPEQRQDVLKAEQRFANHTGMVIADESHYLMSSEDGAHPRAICCDLNLGAKAP